MVTMTNLMAVNNSYESQRTVERIKLEYVSWSTNFYEKEEDRRYQITYKIPKWHDKTMVGITMNHSAKKMLMCGDTYVWAPPSINLLPETMKWLPALKYHDYTIVLYDLKDLDLEPIIIGQCYVDNSDEPHTAMLICNTGGCGPDCKTKGKPNYFSVLDGMGTLRFHCNKCPNKYIIEKETPGTHGYIEYSNNKRIQNLFSFNTKVNFKIKSDNTLIVTETTCNFSDTVCFPETHNIHSKDGWYHLESDKHINITPDTFPVKYEIEIDSVTAVEK